MLKYKSIVTVLPITTPAKTMPELTLADVLRELRSDIRQMGEDVHNEVRQELSGFRGGLDEIKHEVQGLKADVGALKFDVDELKTDVNGLKSDVNALKNDVDGLKTDVSGLKTDLEGVKIQVQELSREFNLSQKWQDRTWDVVKWGGGISAPLSIVLVGFSLRFAITGS
ncbi:MAG: hypothetical protein CV045_10810 [Cyanobacteria bacterium M5B4]|nr:MAG: hypothetical protein CV045_10810 [Cyanobacteria bacterium M5B4]